MKNIILFCIVLAGCGSNHIGHSTNAVKTPDTSIVRAIAVMQVSSDHQTAMSKFFIPKAYAASGSTTVTYSNSPSVTFTLDVSAFQAGTMTGNVLSLGNVVLSGIKDNNLKVCGVSNNQKCTTAILRVYTTGSIQGFVNSVDGYGVPVLTSGLNPSVQVPLNSPGIQIETLSISSSKHTVNLADFSQTSFTVTSDFSNAGSGSYSMTYVVEYALQ